MAEAPDFDYGQPAPQQGKGPSVHDLVVNDIKHRLLGVGGISHFTDVHSHHLIDLMNARRDYGFNKYKSILQAHNGRDVLIDMTEEGLDLLAYSRAHLEENPKSEGARQAYRFTFEAMKHILNARIARGDFDVEDANVE